MMRRWWWVSKDGNFSFLYKVFTKKKKKEWISFFSNIKTRKKSLEFRKSFTYGGFSLFECHPGVFVHPQCASFIQVRTQQSYLVRIKTTGLKGGLSPASSHKPVWESCQWEVLQTCTRPVVWNEDKMSCILAGQSCTGLRSPDLP